MKNVEFFCKRTTFFNWFIGLMFTCACTLFACLWTCWKFHERKTFLMLNIIWRPCEPRYPAFQSNWNTNCFVCIQDNATRKLKVASAMDQKLNSWLWNGVCYKMWTFTSMSRSQEYIFYKSIILFSHVIVFHLRQTTHMYLNLCMSGKKNSDFLIFH